MIDLHSTLQEIKGNLPEWLSEALDIVLEYGKPATTGEILPRYNNFTSCNTQLLLLKSQLSPDNSQLLLLLCINTTMYLLYFIVFF